jgi:hypothetical protein
MRTKKSEKKGRERKTLKGKEEGEGKGMEKGHNF